MYYQVAFVPGGQAIGFLETFFAKLAKALKKLIFGQPRSSRTVTPEEAEGIPDAA